MVEGTLVHAVQHRPRRQSRHPALASAPDPPPPPEFEPILSVYREPMEVLCLPEGLD